jgi:hypothetical protein
MDRVQDSALYVGHCTKACTIIYTRGGFLGVLTESWRNRATKWQIGLKNRTKAALSTKSVKVRFRVELYRAACSAPEIRLTHQNCTIKPKTRIVGCITALLGALLH